MHNVGNKLKCLLQNLLIIYFLHEDKLLRSGPQWTSIINGIVKWWTILGIVFVMIVEFYSAISYVLEYWKYVSFENMSPLDLLMLQLLRPNSSNLPCLYSTFHLEYPLVLSRICLVTFIVIYVHEPIKHKQSAQICLEVQQVNKNCHYSSMTIYFLKHILNLITLTFFSQFVMLYTYLW